MNDFGGHTHKSVDMTDSGGHMHKSVDMTGPGGHTHKSVDLTDFGGHTFIGIAFIFFGLRWTYCTIHRYFLCRRELMLTPGRSRRFRSSLMFPVSWCPGFPLEAAVWLLAVILVSASEIATITRVNFHEHIQHLIMFFFYGTAAVVIILHHYGYPMIPDVDYVGVILCIVYDVYLINRHIQMKSSLEVQMHVDSMVVMMVGALMLCLEIKYRHNPLLSLIRAFSFSLGGTWLIMEDFVLHKIEGRWPNEDHKFLMLATLSFGLHFIGNLLLVGLISCLVLRRVRSFSPAEVSLALDKEGLCKRKDMDHKLAGLSLEQGEHLLSNYDDDDN